MILQTLLIYVTAAAAAAATATHPIFQYGIVLNKDVNSLFSFTKIRPRARERERESGKALSRQQAKEKHNNFVQNTNKCKFLVRCVVQIRQHLNDNLPTNAHTHMHTQMRSREQEKKTLAVSLSQ